MVQLAITGETADRASKRAALYASGTAKRPASTRGPSVAAQKAAIRKFIGTRGWKLVAEYVDDSPARGPNGRPAFHQMIKDALSGQLEVIVVQSASRLVRDYSLTQRYRKTLADNGISVASVSDAGEGESTLILQIMTLCDELHKQQATRRRKLAAARKAQD